MTLKHTIVGAIIALLLSTAAFLTGMHYTLTHMELESDGYGDSVLIYLNDQIYLHGLNGYPLDYDEPLTACYPVNID